MASSCADVGLSTLFLPGVIRVVGAGLLLTSAKGERPTMPVFGVLWRVTGRGEPKARIPGAGVNTGDMNVFSFPLGVAI